MSDEAFERADRKGFWEGKILVWEGGRYELQDGRRRSLMERIADWSSSSLRFRLRHSAEVLAPHVAGKVVLDVGCGSALLAPALLKAGATHYIGYDIAESAIAAARARAESEGWADKATLELKTVMEMGPQEADVVVSLGLTDWLTDEELDHLFAVCGDAHFLHAISELKQVPTQWIHRAYCWLSYGWRNGGYVPRYFTASWFANLARRHRGGDVYILRDKRLTFGAFMLSLPVGEKVG